MLKKLFMTKSIDALRNDAESGQGLKRTLNAVDLTLFGIGAILGTGIFVVTGQAAALHAGPGVVFSFLIAGFAAALAGLCYSEMATMIPVAGSAYTYAYAALGELVAFVIGWDLMLAYALGLSFISVGWSGYVRAFVAHTTGYVLPKEWSSPPIVFDEVAGVWQTTGAIINLPAVLIVLALAWLVVLGVRESARLNALIVMLKIAVVLVFLVAAIGFVHPDNWSPLIPANRGAFGAFGWSGVLHAASMVFISYIGFDAVSVAAQESRNPQRDVPIGILASLGICTVLYIAVSLMLTGLVSYTTLAVAHPMAVGIAATGIGWLETVIEIGAIAGLSSGMLMMLLAQPRIVMSMAKDGLLPAPLAKIHPKYQTPYVATLLSVVFCAVMGGFFSVDVLGDLVTLGVLLAFVLASLGVMILRVRRPNLARPFKVPGGAFLVPGLSALISGGLMLTSSYASLWRLMVWIAVGLVFYGVYGYSHSKLRANGVVG